MLLTNRLTEFLGIEHPILLAPMNLVSGGRLAAAVTAAGGLGLIGGGYGDADWLRDQFGQADGARVGCGFITWSLNRQPELLDIALAHQPAAIMLSFGDPLSFAERVRRANVPLICQVQTLGQARRALEAGADIIVAQGGEAGGHGMGIRSTFTLVPDVVDFVAEQSAEAMVVAAGGVADGRGVAAALALGADGVLVGTRFWACTEALVSRKAHQRAIKAGGDDTVRTRVYDIVREQDWPGEFNERLITNPFINAWHGNESQLLACLPEAVGTFETAIAAEDFDVASILVGEAVGLVHDVHPVDVVVQRMVHDAVRILNRPEACLHRDDQPAGSSSAL
jgi:nitronate monooxygenase